MFRWILKFPYELLEFYDFSTVYSRLFNPWSVFRWSPEGPVSQIHSTHLLVGAPAIFSDLLRFVQMLKRERESGVRKATGSYRTYLFLVKLQPRFLRLQWKTCPWAEQWYTGCKGNECHYCNFFLILIFNELFKFKTSEEQQHWMTASPSLDCKCIKSLAYVVIKIPLLSLQRCRDFQTRKLTCNGVWFYVNYIEHVIFFFGKNITSL